MTKAEYMKEWRKKNKEHYTSWQRARYKNRSEEDKEERRAWLRAHYKRKLDWLRAFKSKPCMDCRRPFPEIAMDFDHVRGTKEFTIGTYLRNVSFIRLKKEIEKCDIVCSNCHRIRTAQRRLGTWPKV